MGATTMAPDELARVLRSYNPHSVRAYDAHDDVRDIDVPAVRNRWKRTAATIAARAWVRLDLLGKSGKVLAHVDRADEPGEVEELSASPEARGAYAREERLLALHMRAVREARSDDARGVRDMLDGCREMMRVVTDAVRSLAEVQRAQVTALRAVAERERDSGEPMTDELVKALLPGMVAGMMRPAPPANVNAPPVPPNGSKG